MPNTRDSGSVLIVAASQTSFASIRSIIQGSFPRISQALSMTQAKQKVAAGGVDILIVNTPAPDEFGVQSALDMLSRNRRLLVILLVKQDVYAQAAMTTRGSGIYVLAKPLKGQVLLEAANNLENMRQRFQALETEMNRLKTRIDDMGLITRAKCLLIEKKQMSEEESHYYLERLAMDNAMSKKEAAQQIIRELAGE